MWRGVTGQAGDVPDPNPPEPALRPGAKPGDGWDDGRGGRPPADRNPRSRGRARRPRTDDARPGAGRGIGGLLGGLPRWAVPAAAAGVVLLLVLVLVVFRGGGGRSDAGACLTDLSEHLPESSSVAFGSDLVQARDAGYDDGGELEDLGSTQRETGTLPDPLTQQLRFGRLVSVEDFTARTGVEPGQVDCALSDGARSVLSGSFDEAEVNGSTVADDGDLAATEDRLGYATGDGDPERLLEPRDGGGLGSNDDVAAVITSLRDADSYSLLVQVGNPNAEVRARAAGLGVADADGDDRALLVAWSFADDDAATAGRPEVVERVNDALRGVTSISADDLQVDGSLVTATITTREAPDLNRILQTGTSLIPAD